MQRTRVSVHRVRRGTVFAVALAALLLTLATAPAAARAATPADPDQFPSRGTLVFGMSAPFTGPNRNLGLEFYRGISAFLNHLNESGGVNGLRLEVLPLDDRYDPEPTLTNTIRLVQRDRVFALFSYVGTPTVTRMLPLLKRFEDEDVYLLFPLTGAQPHRQPPYERYVYNLRASYSEETGGLVEHLVAVGRQRIAVLYQEDAYGRSGWEGVRRALRGFGLRLAADASYRRGAPFAQSFAEQVRLLAASRPDAIIVIGTAASSAAFIRDARDLGLSVPIASVSFADADNIVRLLDGVARDNGRDYTAGLIFSQVVPSYENLTLPTVGLYRRLMDRYAEMPSGLAGDYTPCRYSAVSFEGFLNAMLLAEMVRRLPPGTPRRADIPAAMEGIRDLDLGIGEPLTFGPDRHQAQNRVYYSSVDNGLILPIRDWNAWWNRP